jgi:uncharacterized protein DUF2721
MSDGTASTTAVALISAMVTPALLIVGSASLVASVLVRMARVVDRARVLTAIAHDGSWDRIGTTPHVLRGWLDRHATRARYAERSIALLYAAVVVFVMTALSIPLDRATDNRLEWLPVLLAIAGTLLLLGGGTWMVAESRLSADQIQDEIGEALRRLEEHSP